MSESIKIKYLSDIRNVQWYFEDGGRIKTRNGSFRGVDYYPEYYYDACSNSPVSIFNKPIQYICFKKISPRTLTHKDKVGMILIKYKFINNQTVFKHWCDEWSLDDWLEENVTLELKQRSNSVIEVPKHRRIIQKLNEQQRNNNCYKEKSYCLQDALEDDEYDKIYNYKDYSWDDMINDAFEGDESNYWNID